MYIVDTRTYSSTFPLSSNFEQMVPQSVRCGVENREVPLKLELGHVGGWRPAGQAEGHELRFLVGPPWVMMGGWLGDNGDAGDGLRDVPWPGTGFKVMGMDMSTNLP